MRSPPTELPADSLRHQLVEGWGMQPASMEYVPEGGGSHHWRLAGEDGRVHFVTVDDLDNKDWLGDDRESVLDGLGRALRTAHDLRHGAGLDFVVAPAPARDGGLLRRLDARYTVSVFPFLPGRSYPFGPYTDAPLRDRALDMIATLHRSTPEVRDTAPRHVLRYGGRSDLDAFLADPGCPWDGGPFSEPARHLLAGHAADLAEVAAGFDQLAGLTAPARADTVITHGEPHPANLMAVNGSVVVIDWDTVGLGPPERDVALIATSAGEGIDRYERATGTEINPAVVTLYRLRWYLDDLCSAVCLFRRPHQETPDTRRWWEGLAPRLARLPAWLAALERTDGPR